MRTGQRCHSYPPPVSTSLDFLHWPVLTSTTSRKFARKAWRTSLLYANTAPTAMPNAAIRRLWIRPRPLFVCLHEPSAQPNCEHETKANDYVARIALYAGAAPIFGASPNGPSQHARPDAIEDHKAERKRRRLSEPATLHPPSSISSLIVKSANRVTLPEFANGFDGFIARFAWNADRDEARNGSTAARNLVVAPVSTSSEGDET